jgi:hypothetical protein
MEFNALTPIVSVHSIRGIDIAPTRSARVREHEPNLVERLSQQAADPSARQSHAPGDLGVREVVLEAQGEDSQLALWQRPQRVSQRLAFLDASQGRILARHCRRGQRSVVIVKRNGAVGIACDACFEHLIF